MSKQDDELREIFKIATGCDRPGHANYQFCEYCEVLAPKAKQKLETLIRSRERAAIEKNQIEIANWINTHLEAGDLETALIDRLAELQKGEV